MHNNFQLTVDVHEIVLTLEFVESLTESNDIKFQCLSNTQCNFLQFPKCLKKENYRNSILRYLGQRNKATKYNGCKYFLACFCKISPMLELSFSHPPIASTIGLQILDATWLSAKKCETFIFSINVFFLRNNISLEYCWPPTAYKCFRKQFVILPCCLFGNGLTAIEEFKFFLFYELKCLHRPIQHQAVSDLSFHEITIIWSTLENSSDPFLMFAICKKILTFVKHASISCEDSISRLLTLIRTTKILSPLITLLFEILKVCVFQELSTDVDSELFFCKYANTEHYNTALVRQHPLVVLILERPDAWPYVIHQLRDFFYVRYPVEDPRNYKFNLFGFRMLLPFFNFLFLFKKEEVDNLNLTVGKNSVLQILSRDIFYEIHNVENYMFRDFSKVVLDFFMLIVRLNPPTKNVCVYSQLYVETLSSCLMLIANKIDSFLFYEGFFVIMSYVLESKLQHLYIGNLLRALDNLSTAMRIFQIDTNELWLLCNSVAYLLLDVMDCGEERGFVLKLLNNVIDIIISQSEVENNTPSVILSLCVIPLLQILSDGGDVKQLEVASNTLSKIEEYVLGGSKHNMETKNFEIRSPINSSWPLQCIAQFLSLTVKSVSKKPCEILLSRLSLVNSSLTLINLSPFLFHSKVEHQLETLIFLNKNSNNFPPYSLFSVYLYLSKKSQNPHLQHLIFTKLLPNLASTSDVFPTGSVLQIVMRLLQADSRKQDCELFKLGALSLLQLFIKQPRIWVRLKEILMKWILKKSSINFGHTKNFETDLTMLGILRVISKRAEYGQELFSIYVSYIEVMLTATLGSECFEFIDASLYLIFQGVRNIIVNMVIDVRAAWNVLINRIISYLGHRAQHSKLLLHEICRYFELIGKLSQDTETYIQFRQDALISIISTLDVSKTIDTELPYSLPYFKLNGGGCLPFIFRAASCFPASDLYPFFSCPVKLVSVVTTNLSSNTRFTKEETADFNRELILTPVIGSAELLAKLISSEIKSMRKSVFKGVASNSWTANKGTVKEEKDNSQEAVLKAIGELSVSINETLDSGKLFPGLKATAKGGFAAVALNIRYPSSVNVTKSFLQKGGIPVLIYRRLELLIKDLPTWSITDSLFTRLYNINSWSNFWENSIFFQISNLQVDGKRADAKIIAEEWFLIFYNYLFEHRLESSKTPGQIFNTLLGISGLINCGKKLFLNSVAGSSIELIEKFLLEFNRVSNPISDRSIFGDFFANEEVKIGMLVAIYSAACALHVTDHILLKKVVRFFIDLNKEEHDDELSWLNFFSRYGLSLILKNLIILVHPSLDEVGGMILENFEDEILDLNSNQPSTQFGSIFGIELIFNLLLNQENMETAFKNNMESFFKKIIEFLVDKFYNFEVKELIFRSFKDKVFIISCLWLLPCVINTEFLHKNSNDVFETWRFKLSFLEDMLKKSKNLIDIEVIHEFVLVSKSKLLRANDADLFNQFICDTTEEILSGVGVNHTKYSTLAVFPYLLGIDPLTSHYITNNSFELVLKAFHCISSFLIGNDPKLSRLCGTIIGIIISSLTDFQESLLARGEGSFVNNGLTNNTVTNLQLENSSLNSSIAKKDPSNLKRLNISISYLRATFDELSSEHLAVTGAELLMKTLLLINIPFPLTNWSFTLHSLKKKSFDLSVLTFVFSSNHSSIEEARSLTDFFVHALGSTLTSATRRQTQFSAPADFFWDLQAENSESQYIKDIIVSTVGIGKLLKLAGLRTCSMERNDLFPNVLSASTVLNIFEDYLYWLFSSDFANEKLQINFFATLLPFLFWENRTLDSNSLRADLIKLIFQIFMKLPDTASSELITSIILILPSDESSCNGLMEYLGDMDVVKSDKGCISLMAVASMIMKHGGCSSLLITLSWTTVLKKPRDKCDLTNFNEIGNSLILHILKERLRHSNLRFSTILRFLDVICGLDEKDAESGIKTDEKCKIKWIINILDIIIYHSAKTISLKSENCQLLAVEFEWNVLLPCLANVWWGSCRKQSRLILWNLLQKGTKTKMCNEDFGAILHNFNFIMFNDFGKELKVADRNMIAKRLQKIIDNLTSFNKDSSKKLIDSINLSYIKFIN
ncbi:hypothetical protein HDU92_005406 [Lobulomyces angularis]|nr:hypothetical protein HDU92_005406 [Lobulomyces angularis]